MLLKTDTITFEISGVIANWTLKATLCMARGGAGAFSDGKIYTRKRDGELGWVFRRLVDFGADPEILEEGWAHLGTDKIRQILPNLRHRITELNGRVHFGACVTDLLTEDDGRCVGVRFARWVRRESRCSCRCDGSLSRDSWRMMLDAGAKPSKGPIRIRGSY